MSNIEFSVNGRAVTVQAVDNVSLLNILRGRLELRATRYGCGTGHCGACTVLVDGRPENSCEFPAGGWPCCATGHDDRTGTRRRFPLNCSPIPNHFLYTERIVSGAIWQTHASLLESPSWHFVHPQFLHLHLTQVLKH